jgi:hypothetical protein
MRSNNLQKKDLYWIGQLLGEDVYLLSFNERTAEIAERILAKIITDADLKQGNISIPPDNRL